MSSTIESKRREAKSILFSNIIYAIQLKRNELENMETKDMSEPELVIWLTKKEDEYRKAGLSANQVVDALYALMVRKQEVAGLTANSEKTMTSKMNMLISQVERDGRRD